MRITILTVGSRGDIEPFVALGEGLQDSGHVVTIATEARFENFAKERGLKFALVPGDTHAALNSEECQRALYRKNNTKTFFNILISASAALSTQSILQNINACKDAEHIICTPWSLHTGYFISKELSVPMSVASVNATVMSDTKYFHNLMFPVQADRLPGVFQKRYSSISHKVIAGQRWKWYKEMFGKSWKEATGLVLPKQDQIAAYAKTKPLLLYGYSQHVLPKPADWSDNQHVTGYWLLKRNKDWKPTPELEKFIEAGPAPVYIGFGSMNNSMLKEGSLEKLILETVERTKQRAVILKSGLNIDAGKLSTNVYATEPVPFNYLFKKMRLLVHHAGAGTTALGLMAGVPQVFTPLIVDQRFWAWRAYKCGAAVKPLHWYNLKAEGLVNAINRTTADDGIRTRALELGVRINEERGVETAVAVFNKAI